MNSSLISFSLKRKLKSKIVDAKFSPNSLYIALTDENGLIELWDLRKQQLLKTFKNYSSLSESKQNLTVHCCNATHKFVIILIYSHT